MPISKISITSRHSRSPFVVAPSRDGMWHCNSCGCFAVPSKRCRDPQASKAVCSVCFRGSIPRTQPPHQGTLSIAMNTNTLPALPDDNASGVEAAPCGRSSALPSSMDVSSPSVVTVKTPRICSPKSNPDFRHILPTADAGVRDSGHVDALLRENPLCPRGRERLVNLGDHDSQTEASCSENAYVDDKPHSLGSTLLLTAKRDADLDDFRESLSPATGHDENILLKDSKSSQDFAIGSLVWAGGRGHAGGLWDPWPGRVVDREHPSSGLRRWTIMLFGHDRRFLRMASTALKPYFPDEANKNRRFRDPRGRIACCLANACAQLYPPEFGGIVNESELQKHISPEDLAQATLALLPAPGKNIKEQALALPVDENCPGATGIALRKRATRAAAARNKFCASPANWKGSDVQDIRPNTKSRFKHAKCKLAAGRSSIVLDVAADFVKVDRPDRKISKPISIPMPGQFQGVGPTEGQPAVYGEDDQPIAMMTTAKENSSIFGMQTIDFGLSVPEWDCGSSEKYCSPKHPCKSGDALEAGGSSLHLVDSVQPTCPCTSADTRVMRDQQLVIERTSTHVNSNRNCPPSPTADVGVVRWKEGLVVSKNGARAENDTTRRRPRKLAFLGSADVASEIAEFVSVGYSRLQREQLHRDLSDSCMRYMVNGRALLARWQEPSMLAQMILFDRYKRLGISGDGVLWATAEFIWLARDAEKMNVVD